MSDHAATLSPPQLRAPVVWGIVVGVLQLKDLWQHRTHFVRGTRWWPPFCASVDFVAAAIIAGEIAAGMDFG